MSASTPVKHESTTQKGLFFWAERVAPALSRIESYCVMAQAKDGPASEAFGDWFAKFSDADEIAAKLALGDDME